MVKIAESTYRKSVEQYWFDDFIKEIYLNV